MIETFQTSKLHFNLYVRGTPNLSENKLHSLFFVILKKTNMTISDLKLKIFRQIDSLEKNRLEELYRVLTNFMNEQKDINDWDNLTKKQQHGIIEAIDEIDSGKGIPHEKVMEYIHKKYQLTLQKIGI